jgi:hypothetical protein
MVQLDHPWPFGSTNGGMMGNLSFPNLLVGEEWFPTSNWSMISMEKTTQTRNPDHQPPKILAVAHLKPQKAPTWCRKNRLKTSHWTFMVPVRNPPDFHSSMAFSMAIIHVKDIGCEAWGSLGS